MIVSCNKSLGTRKYIENKTRRKGGEGDRVVGERGDQWRRRMMWQMEPSPISVLWCLFQWGPHELSSEMSDELALRLLSFFYISTPTLV